jgi:PEP-CTERM motif
MLVNGAVVDTYSASPGTLVPPTSGGGNGNGYADYTLTGFSSLASLGANDTIQFHVVMPLVNSGREEFFLLSDNTPQVPEPISVVLTGSGLLGLFLLRRRSRAR